MNFRLWLIICAIAGIALVRSVRDALLFLTSAVISFGVVFGLEKWRAHRERLQRDFELWLDRAAAIARQWDIYITGDDEPSWRQRFESGCSPQDAVDLEKAAKHYQ